MNEHLTSDRSLYVGDRDRFVVMLAVGYATDDGPRSPQQAAHWALELTRDAGSDSTRWYVLDRQTGVIHEYEQADIEDAEDDPDLEQERGLGIQEL